MKSASVGILGSFALAAVMGLAVKASGATLYLSDVSQSVPVNVTFPVVGTYLNPNVGAIHWTFDASNPANTQLDAYASGTLTSFCIEGTQQVFLHHTTTFGNILTDLSQAPQDGSGSAFEMGDHSVALQKFWDAYFADSEASNVSTAAFQLGIWDIVYDGGTGLTSGNFSATALSGNADSAAAIAQATTWLAELPNVTPTTTYNLAVLSDPRYQDQLFDPVAVPVPPALPAGLALLGGLAVFAKLRRR